MSLYQSCEATALPEATCNPFPFPQWRGLYPITATDCSIAFARSGISEVIESCPCVPELLVSDSVVSSLALQLTFLTNKGFCIGVTRNHAVPGGKRVSGLESAYLNYWLATPAADVNSVIKCELNANKSCRPNLDRTAFLLPCDAIMLPAARSLTFMEENGVDIISEKLGDLINGLDEELFQGAKKALLQKSVCTIESKLQTLLAALEKECSFGDSTGYDASPMDMFYKI
ncbi:hypothetical protein D5086_025741 [Populus alba]|uniref:Uncharacterized protein n=1 Tax=Populus alba TaxID=43335 RepID=A0ACC4B0W2_POPAL